MTHTPDHRERASARLSPAGKRFFELIEFDEEEELVMEIRKHPFGLFVIEFTGTTISIFLTGAFIALAYLAKGDSLGEASSSLRLLLLVVGMFLGVVGIIMTAVSALLYRSNVIYITSEKIAQVVYRNIISRKISQLGIGDVQDVTVDQNNLFARIFHFGTLTIETAGEQENYTFTYVPNPYESAKAIVGAHELNLRHFGN